MTSEPNTAFKPAAPLPLWRAMRAFLCMLHNLLGGPDALASRGFISRRDRALMAPWLRAGEAFLRRLLFVEALALAPQLTLARPRVRACRVRTRRTVAFYPDKPEDWRVWFRLSTAPARRSRGARRRLGAKPLEIPIFLMPPKPEPCRLWQGAAIARAALARTAAPASPRARDSGDPWPFAERLEAMTRAFNAPGGAVQRLARLMVRNEARALRALTPAPAHIARLFGAPHFARCNAIVASRRRKHDRARREADTS